VVAAQGVRLGYGSAIVDDGIVSVKVRTGRAAFPGALDRRSGRGAAAATDSAQ
jgi:hypothetical protein